MAAEQASPGIRVCWSLKPLSGGGTIVRVFPSTLLPQLRQTRQAARRQVWADSAARYPVTCKAASPNVV